MTSSTMKPQDDQSAPIQITSSYDDLIPPKIVRNPDGEKKDNAPVVTGGTRRRRSLGRASTSRRRGSWGKPGSVTNRGKNPSIRWAQPQLESLSIPCNYGGLSREEVRQVWYRSRDYESFEKEKKKTIQKIRRAQGDVTRLNPSKYCLRGLEEYQSVERHRELRHKRIECVQRILVEQDRQRFLNIQDPMHLRSISLEYSTDQIQEAIHLAERDERHAMEEHREHPENFGWNGRTQPPTGRRSSFKGMRRRVSQRYVAVDKSATGEVPRSRNRDSLTLTQLKGSVAAFHQLLEDDPELRALANSDGDDDKASNDSDSNDGMDDSEGLSLADIAAMIEDPSDDENESNDGPSARGGLQPIESSSNFAYYHEHKDDDDDDDNNTGEVTDDNDDAIDGGDDQGEQSKPEISTPHTLIREQLRSSATLIRARRSGPVRLDLNDSLSQIPRVMRQRRPGGVA